MKYVRRIPVLAVTLLVAACYSYEPLNSPTPGTEIRAQLTAEAAVRRSQGLVDPVLHYDGVVVEARPDTLAVDVLVARRSSAFQDVEIRDTMRLARTEIQAIHGRKLSVVKSVLFTVATGVVAFAVVKGIDQIAGGTGDENGEPPPGARVPVLRWITSILRPSPAHSRQ